MDISKIETFFNSLLDGKVSDNTFFTDLPRAIKDDWKTITLVDVASLDDMNGYGHATVNIFLYAKPKPNGIKNVPVLAQMEAALDECISSNTDPHYKLTSTNNKYTDYDNQRDLHCNIIEYNLLII